MTQYYESGQAAQDKKSYDEIQKNNLKNSLPDIEIVADKVHQSWMEGKKAKGITSRKAEDGEELMVPYGQLSETQKAMDRSLVETVYKAMLEVMK